MSSLKMVQTNQVSCHIGFLKNYYPPSRSRAISLAMLPVVKFSWRNISSTLTCFLQQITSISTDDIFLYNSMHLLSSDVLLLSWSPRRIERVFAATCSPSLKRQWAAVTTQVLPICKSWKKGVQSWKLTRVKLHWVLIWYSPSSSSLSKAAIQG